jgi:hypothetical protein
LQVKFHCSYVGEALNIMHVKYSGSAPSNADAVAIASSLATIWGSDIAPFLNHAVIMHEVEVTDLTSPTSAYGAFTTAVGGGTSGPGQESGAAFMADWEISTRYRGGHPRSYFIGISDSDMADASHITSGAVAAVQAGAGAFLTDVNALVHSPVSPFHLGCVHRFVFGAHPPTPLTVPTFDPFVAADAGSRVKSQRRRLGRGA